MVYFLLLDPDNLLEPVGKISRKQLMIDWDCTDSKLDWYLNKNKLYENRYVVVEDETSENSSSSSKTNEIYMVKFQESPRKIYYACNDGTIRHVDKFSHKESFLQIHYNSKNGVYVYIQKKRINAKVIMAKTFFKNYRDGDFVKQIDDSNPLNIHPDNLKIIPRDEYFRSLQHQRVCIPIGLYSEGKCVQKWRSITEAAKELAYDKSTVCDILAKNRIKKGYLDLRYL